MSPDTCMPAKPDVPPKTGVGQRLAHALKVRGRSSYWLQKNAPLATGYVYRILDGKAVDLGAETFEKIAKALDISYEWLASGKGNMDRTSLPLQWFQGATAPENLDTTEVLDPYASVETTELFQRAPEVVQVAFRSQKVKLPDDPFRAVRRATERLLQLIARYEDGLLEFPETPRTVTAEEHSSEVREKHPRKAVGGAKGAR